MITGGVPCQSWSVAGRKKGFDDERGALWFDAIRAVKICNPKIFIFENVKGLSDPKHKKSFLLILRKLQELGYDVYSKVLNAYDFGLPQNRDRIFIVGIKSDIDKYKNFIFPESTGENPKLYEFLDNIKINKSHLNRKVFNPFDIFGNKVPYSRNRFQKLNYLNDFFIFCDTRDGHSTIHSWDLTKTTQKEKKICLTILKNRRKKIYGEFDGNPLSFLHLKDLIPDIKKKDLRALIKKRIICEKDKNKFDLSNTKNSAGLNSVYRIFLPQSQIFSTLTATGTNDYVATVSIPQNDIGSYKELFLDKIYYAKKYRPITPKEASRLQGFPNDFKIHKKRSIAMKQFGNAVPTNTVYHLMKSIMDYISDSAKKSKIHVINNKQLRLM